MKFNAVLTTKFPFGPRNEINKLIYINFGIITAGLFGGVIIYTLTDVNDLSDIIRFYINFSVNFSDKSYAEIISGIILEHLPYTFAIIICSTSMIGVYIIPFLSFFKSAGLCYVVSFLVSTYGIKGIEYCVMIFFPGKFFVLLFMMLLMYTGMTSSIDIKNLTRGESQKALRPSDSVLKLSVSILILLLACVIDFLAIISFSSLFDFR